MFVLPGLKVVLVVSGKPVHGPRPRHQRQVKVVSPLVIKLPVFVLERGEKCKKFELNCYHLENVLYFIDHGFLKKPTWLINF